MPDQRTGRGHVQAHLVCGGRFHDFDFARLQLLTLLAEHEEIRTTVASDYRDVDALANADLLVTYTCDVRPTAEQQQALRSFTADRRWLALHGTNALFDVGRGGAVIHDDGGWLRSVVGSRFLAHPPIAPYPVRLAAPDHPLVRGIGTFEVTDELYLSEVADGIQVLLDAEFSGRAPGFADDDWSQSGRHPVAYLYGNVYYLTLGHCRGHYDLYPLMRYYPQVERGAWELPVFTELLRRGIAWASHGRSAAGA